MRSFFIHLSGRVALLALLPGAGCALNTAGGLEDLDAAAGEPDAASGDWMTEMKDQDPSTDWTIPEARDGEAEPPASCASDPGFCADGLDCTDDVCIDAPEGPSCRNDVRPGFCVIDGRCNADGALDPGNECQICRADNSNSTWTPADDLTPCSGGICCAGSCRIGGECCSGDDCIGCRKTPWDCASLTSRGSCEHQDGCTWNSVGSCSGDIDCSTWDENNATCTACGCRYESDGDCRGSDSAHCSDSGSLTACESRGVCGCVWQEASGSCSGSPLPCSAYDSQEGCNNHAGCSWVTVGNCSPFTFTCTI
jgi:hypothetical protein